MHAPKTPKMLLLCACALCIALASCRTTDSARSSGSTVVEETRVVDTTVAIPGDTARRAYSFDLLGHLLADNDTLELLSEGRLRVLATPIFGPPAQPDTAADSAAKEACGARLRRASNAGRPLTGLRLTGVCEPDSLAIYQYIHRRTQRDTTHERVTKTPRPRWPWLVGGVALGLLAWPLGKAVLSSAFRRFNPFA